MPCFARLPPEVEGWAPCLLPPGGWQGAQSLAWAEPRDAARQLPQGPTATRLILLQGAEPPAAGTYENNMALALPRLILGCCQSLALCPPPCLTLCTCCLTRAPLPPSLPLRGTGQGARARQGKGLGSRPGTGQGARVGSRRLGAPPPASKGHIILGSSLNKPGLN